MPDFPEFEPNGTFRVWSLKISEIPTKGRFLRVLQKCRYLNVVYKVRLIACTSAIFPTDLHSTEVVSWDDLTRGK
jgi:hypothetical protein